MNSIVPFQSFNGASPLSMLGPTADPTSGGLDPMAMMQQLMQTLMMAGQQQGGCCGGGNCGGGGCCGAQQQMLQTNQMMGF